MFDEINMGRRRFMARTGVGIASAAALVVGFDPTAKRWVTEAEAQDASLSGSSEFSDFAAAPPLDGSLHFDDATSTADSTDQGNIVHRRPHAVLRPGSVADIAKMVRYCRRHRIQVAPRGTAHTVFGQGLVSGLLIEMRGLSRIHSISPRGAVVDAGVLWQELIEAAFHQGQLTPPVLTSYVGLTVGGTLSVGGADGNAGHYDRGLQIDHVQELEVVTGAGEVVQCSMHSNRDLFEAVLGGVGQCGIITRATVDLVHTPSMVRVYRIHYLDNAKFFRDFRTLLNRGEFDGVYNIWFPNESTVPYELTALAYYEPPNTPDTRHLLRGLGVEAAAAVSLDLTHLQATQFTDNVFIKPMKAALNWDHLIKPALSVWLPDEAIEQYVGDVMSSISVEDIGEAGFMLLVPSRRATMKRPFCRLPEPKQDDWIYLFDLLSAAPLPGPDSTYVDVMLRRNRRLWEKARDAGGTRYPIAAIEFSKEDWRAHYGEVWERFSALKRRFDPDKILTPGPGIF